MVDSFFIGFNDLVYGGSVWAAGGGRIFMV